LCQYTRVSFGLATECQIPVRLLDRIFHDIRFVYLCHSLDNMVVCTDTFEERLLHVEEVLRHLRDSGLTLKPEKVKLEYTKSPFWSTLSPPTVSG